MQDARELARRGGWLPARRGLGRRLADGSAAIGVAAALVGARLADLWPARQAALAESTARGAAVGAFVAAGAVAGLSLMAAGAPAPGSMASVAAPASFVPPTFPRINPLPRNVVMMRSDSHDFFSSAWPNTLDATLGRLPRLDLGLDDRDALPAPPAEPAVPNGLRRVPAAPVRGRASVGLPRDVADACAVSVEVVPLAAAMIGIELAAPCDAGSTFAVQQGLIAATGRLDGDGRAVVEIPALAARPTVRAQVAGRAPLTRRTDTIAFAAYDRIAVRWTGAAALQISAFERGARPGEAGHLHDGNPGGIVDAIARSGGFLDRIEGPNGGTLVYTVPRGIAREVVLEAEVTAANCGRAVEATVLQVGPDGRAARQALAMTLPECDAVGDFVMIGLLDRPRLARLD